MRRASEPTDPGANVTFRSGRAVTFNEVPRATEAVRGRYRGGSDSGREDPASLLKDFDSKLHSIQDVLSRYQAERSSQARSGANGATGNDHERPAATAPSSARRWQPQHQRVLAPGSVLDEEVFVRHVLATPRRIKSAAPGASRALSARIEYYRSHRDKAQEKAEKARGEQLAAQREATGGIGGGVSGPQINFIEANRRSIVPHALPPGLQMTLESLRDQGLSSLGRRRAGGGPGHDTSRVGRPWSAMPQSVRSSVTNLPAGGGGGGGGMYTQRAGTWTGAGPGIHAGWLQPEWEQQPQASGNSTAPSAGRPAVADPTNRRGLQSWDGSADGEGDAGAAGEGIASAPSVCGGSGGGSGRSSPSGLFLTSVDVPPSQVAHAAPAAGAGGGPGFGVHGTSSNDPSPGHLRPACKGPPLLALNLPSRPSTATANGPRTSHAATTRAGATSASAGAGSMSGGPGDGSVAYGSAGVDTRRLRLALSSRPASGGSPTRRVEYIAEHAARRAERAIYAVEVRERAAAIDAERRRTISQAAELRAAQRREEEARLAQARAAADRQERQRQWTGIVGLCAKLSFLSERVLEDRRVRALRVLRKESAVKIAAWYKNILLRRRQRELVSLIKRLRELIRPYLARQKVLVRQRAAMRIVSFLQYTRTSNMAVVGVRKLKGGVETLQNAWRNALLVRNLQRQALYNQLTRVEREMVANNKRSERSMQSQMKLMAKSVNILEPDGALMPVGFGSGRSHRVGSSSFRATGHDGPYGFGFGGGGGMTLDRFAMDASMGRGMMSARQYDRSKQPGRGVLHDTGDEEDEVLRAHMEMVPREVREQVVESFLLEARRDHRKLLEQYSTDKQLYQARKPIEEMRQKMLRDAGVKVEPEIRPPVMPHMRVIYPRAKLRELLRRVVEINQARLAAAEERRQQEAAEMGRSHWLSGDRPGGVLWADMAGHGGDRQLAAIHGSVSRSTLIRRSASRTSLRSPSHKTIKLQPS